jgi:uncharacterized protein (DUF58 family)
MQSFSNFFNLKLKPLKSFWFAILLIILLFVVAYVHNNNVAYIVMFFLFSVILIAIYLGARNIKNMNLELLYEPKVFANRAFKYKAKLCSCGYAIYVQDKRHNINGEKLIDLEYKFNKRGFHKIDSKEIYSYYPLGLIKYIKRVILDKEVLVFPELKGKSLEKSFFSSNSINGYINDFEGLKNYSQSDNISDIHWPSVAKGEMASKKFSYNSESDTLVFDYNLISGDKESKLSQLALWSVEAESMGYKYIVKIDRKVLKDIDEILKTLALY